MKFVVLLLFSCICVSQPKGVLLPLEGNHFFTISEVQGQKIKLDILRLDSDDSIKTLKTYYMPQNEIKESLDAEVIKNNYEIAGVALYGAWNVAQVVVIWYAIFEQLEGKNFIERKALKFRKKINNISAWIERKIKYLEQEKESSQRCSLKLVKLTAHSLNLLNVSFIAGAGYTIFKEMKQNNRLRDLQEILGSFEKHDFPSVAEFESYLESELKL